MSEASGVKHDGALAITEWSITELQWIRAKLILVVVDLEDGKPVLAYQKIQGIYERMREQERFIAGRYPDGR